MPVKEGNGMGVWGRMQRAERPSEPKFSETHLCILVSCGLPSLCSVCDSICGLNWPQLQGYRFHLFRSYILTLDCALHSSAMNAQQITMNK